MRTVWHDGEKSGFLVDPGGFVEKTTKSIGTIGSTYTEVGWRVKVYDCEVEMGGWGRRRRRSAENVKKWAKRGHGEGWEIEARK